MKKVAVVFFSCNRLEYLRPMLEDFHKKVDLSGVEIYKILIDDYPKGRNEDEFRALKDQYGIDHLELNSENLGYSGSWGKAWTLLPTDTDYIWHQEEDFVYNNPVKITEMIRLYESSPVPLTQLVLKRQQWYGDHCDFVYKINSGKVGREVELETGETIIIHHHYFNSNPCLYPYWVTQEEYPHNPQETVIVGELRKRYPDKYSAVLGKKTDVPMVKHIGDFNQGKKVLEGEPGWSWLKNYDPEKKYYSKHYLKEYPES